MAAEHTKEKGKERRQRRAKKKMGETKGKK